MSSIVKLSPKQHTPKSKPERLVCVECGASVEAACSCGVVYQPASAFAALAIIQHPEKSNRALAGELGISKDTVRRKRKSTGAKAPVERIGKDGRKRKLPTNAAPKVPVLTEAESMKLLASSAFDTSSDEDIGAFLEQLGPDKFFAALQHAPMVMAAIDARSSRRQHHHVRDQIVTLIGEVRVHIQNPKPANIEAALKKLARIVKYVESDGPPTTPEEKKPALDTNAFGKAMCLDETVVTPSATRMVGSGAQVVADNSDDGSIPGFLKRGVAA